MHARPKLVVPQLQAQEYLWYWGDIEYVEFCAAFGLPRLDYGSFARRTMAESPYWWAAALDLNDINKVPSPTTYRTLLEQSHPHEFTGPTRFQHYIKQYKGNRMELLERLDGTNDKQWREWAQRI